MKNNNTRVGKSVSQDLDAKRRMEDRIFNRMLVWLAVAVVVEIYFVLVNRFYVHARAGEIDAMVAWHKALLFLFFAGVVLFALCLVWGRRKWAQGKDLILPFAMSGGFLVAGLGSLLVRTSHSSSHLMLGIVPGLAILLIIFYLYQKEFFPCALVSGLGILTLLCFRLSGYSGKKYLLCLAASLVVTVVCLAVMLKLKQNGGKLTWRGEPLEVLSSGANYLPCFITAVLTVVLCLCPLALGAAAAYYGIWVLGAWVFILAVYFTSKLM